MMVSDRMRFMAGIIQYGAEIPNARGLKEGAALDRPLYYSGIDLHQPGLVPYGKIIGG